MDIGPLQNPRWEAYCRERAAGKTQCEAVLSAYPKYEGWKRDSLDKCGQRLEKRPQVRARIDALLAAAAEHAVITRAEVIDGMARTFRLAQDADGLNQTAVNAVSSIGRTLLDALPEERPETVEAPAVDFGLVLAPPFLAMHRGIAGESHGDFWLPGGRVSGKSSAVSLEVVDGVVRHPGRSAFVGMKNGVDIRDSAWEQIRWAIETLGYSDEFEERPSLRRIVRRSTGQAIVFRGCDRPDKTKSIKAPQGTYFAYQWFEECDLFRGMDEIRTVEQSITRGAAPGAFFCRFYTFNPPRSRDSWANRETARREDAGMTVHRSTYLDMPPEWVPDRIREDAAELEREDPAAYAHEFLGEPTGIGGEVFDRVEYRTITDDEIAAFERPMAGQDYGWWPDPWAMTLSEWQPGRRTLLTYREDGDNKLTPDRSALRARELLTWADSPDGEPYAHNIPVSSDDAAPEQIAAQRAAGLNARAAQKGNMRLASYRWLASVRWVIDPARCPRLAEEVRGKLHVSTRDGEWTEDVEDGNDHFIDATRYAVMPLVRRWREAYTQPKAG